MGAEVESTCAGIVPAIEHCVRAMPFEVIEPASLLALRAPREKLAAKKAGRPGGVMSLQPQPDVVMVPRQHQHSVRQVASRIEVRCAGKVPQTEECDQQMISIAPLLAEIPRARVGFRGVGRGKSIRRNQGNALGKPQFDLLPVAFRRLWQ